MTKADIQQAISETPLSNDDLADIIAHCTRISLANVFIEAGMDMLAEKVMEAEPAGAEDDDD